MIDLLVMVADHQYPALEITRDPALEIRHGSPDAGVTARDDCP
jgi:hypothetical protein